MTASAAIIITVAAPLLWAAMGGLLSERSGVVNIGLEGMMLAGAMAAVVTTDISGSAWIGVIGAAGAGALLGLLHAWLCLRCRIDQIVSGVAVNLLAAGVTGYAVQAVYNNPGATPSVARIQIWHPFGPGGISIPPLHMLVILAWIVVTVVVTRTPWGLRLHAAGEAPRALRAAGVRTGLIRTAAVTIGGALAGIGGAELSIGQIDHFSIGMTNGRGFLALAALICGRWRPVGILVACFVFGLFDRIGYDLQSSLQVPNQLVLTFPFMAALLALGLSGWGCRPPSALGRVEEVTH